MKYTQSIGNITELKCLIGFIELGYDCSIPYGNNSKYDFIADVNSKLLKIQCKSSHQTTGHGKIDEGSFTFDTTSKTTNTKGIKTSVYSKDEIDYFATCWENKIYLIPVEECNTSKTLRVSPAKNNANYSNACDYELEKVLSKNTQFIKSRDEYLNRFDNHIDNTRLEKERERKTYFCKNCGKEISTNSDYCVECGHTLSRKVERPDRDTLKSLIRTESFTKVGEIYNVSDNSIRKWCKGYNLPFNKTEINSISDSDWEIV